MAREGKLPATWVDGSLGVTSGVGGTGKSGGTGSAANVLSGKKIGIFGSSTSDESFIGSGIYYRVIANRTGLIPFSQAVQGTELMPATATYTADGSMNALRQIDALPADLDLVVGLPGANDERYGRAIGTFTSTATWDFYAAVHKMCQKMIDKWPNIPLGIMATQYMGSPGAGTVITQQTSAYHDAIAEVCRYYGIPFIDLAKEGGVPYSYLAAKDKYVRGDGLHLNDAGNLRMSYRVEAFYRQLAATSATAVADTTPPSNPTNLAASAISNTSLTLAWTASTDGVGVTGYEVRNGTTLIATVAGTSINVTGLSASTTYTFNVQAKDAAGNVSAAASVTAATSAVAALAYEYFISNGPTGSRSGTGSAGFKGSDFTMKVSKELRTVGAYGSPTSWELWRADATAKKLLGTQLTTGTFGAADGEGYAISTLGTPYALVADTYALIVNYPSGTSRYANVPTIPATDDAVLKALADTYNAAGVTDAAATATTGPVYDYKLGLA